MPFVAPSLVVVDLSRAPAMHVPIVFSTSMFCCSRFLCMSFLGTPEIFPLISDSNGLFLPNSPWHLLNAHNVRGV